MIISYSAKINRLTYKDIHILDDTIKYYHKAVSYICDVVLKEWESLENLSLTTDKVNAIESLIHNTARNKAKYDFDKQIYKFPSYIRRDAISSAIGHISSYMSNMDNYKIKRYNAISNGKSLKKKNLLLT